MSEEERNLLPWLELYRFETVAGTYFIAFRGRYGPDRTGSWPVG
jgi:hypothetical protein